MNVSKNHILVKVKSIFLLFFLFSFFVGAQSKFVIILDAGHGGTDPGSKRFYSDLGMVNEKDITLAVTLKLGSKLEQNKNFKVIYTRTTDTYPNLTSRTNLANGSHADLFVSLHCNSSGKSTPYGTETYVQGPNQNKVNLEVAKAENDVIFLDEQDKETFASYDPRSPESLIALKIQQRKYLESSLLLGSFVENNFTERDNRLSRGVKQKDLHVLRLNAMPSILIEMGFISNYNEVSYLLSDSGQNAIAESIYQAILEYKHRIDINRGVKSTVVNRVAEKPKEIPLKNDFRVLLLQTKERYNVNNPALKGLNYILVLKEDDYYKYYYSVTNYSSVRDANVKTAKDAGFRDAVAIGFTPNQVLGQGYYTLEIVVSDFKLTDKSYVLNTLKNMQVSQEDGKYYYTYGKYTTLEAAISGMKYIEGKGIKNIVIQKVNK